VPPGFALEARGGDGQTDGERLRGVLVNPVENAREGPSPPRVGRRGGDRGRARRIEAGRVLLWVSDRGPRAASDLPHVFEPYFTTKRTGTGLGSPSPAGGGGPRGAIRLESRGGEGTRVEIELPAEGPAAREVR